MNKKELWIKRKSTWHKYHIPGQSNLHKRKINAVFLSVANSKEHELKKAEVAYDILTKGHQFITEASTCKGNRRVDVIDLDDGVEYEVETTEKRAKRFIDMPNVEVVLTKHYKPKEGA